MIENIKITSMTAEGNGVGRVDNMTVFVQGAVTGDECEAEIIKKKKTYITAKLKRVIIPSPYRINPKCGAFEKCGGCTLMNLLYERQVEEKRELINNAMRRIGGFKNFELDKMNGAEKTERYRNKVVFSAQNGKFGFYENKTHKLIPIEDCFLAESGFCRIAKVVAKLTDGKIFIRQGTKGKMVLVQTEAKIDGKLLEKVVLEADSKVESIYLNSECIYGKKTIVAEILGLKFEVSAESFLQVNYEMTEKLYRCALGFAALDKESNVMDIYCGIGTISLAAAQNAKNVIGVEIVKQAIENAKINARFNGIENAEFFADSAENAVPNLIENGIKPNVVILDPPRKGSDEKTLTAIINANPERIVYVSCDPATLARDCAKLCKRGYKITAVQGFDMFPQTSHVETVCLMSRICSGG